VVVIAADFVISAISHQGGGSSQTGTPAASSSQFGVVIQGNGGHWTNVSPDQLAQMLGHKDFTLVNVKKPYSDEIAGTDLYIPYDQLTARASELPADKGARILVYCLTGTTSKIAAQTLLGLGYTDVWNLDGGMQAWTASGRALVDKNRQ
jgi:rhodanese-related sulfurtransferase